MGFICELINRRKNKEAVVRDSQETIVKAFPEKPESSSSHSRL